MNSNNSTAEDLEHELEQMFQGEGDSTPAQSRQPQGGGQLENVGQPNLAALLNMDPSILSSLGMSVQDMVQMVTAMTSVAGGAVPLNSAAAPQATGSGVTMANDDALQAMQLQQLALDPAVAAVSTTAAEPAPEVSAPASAVLPTAATTIRTPGPVTGSLSQQDTVPGQSVPQSGSLSTQSTPAITSRTAATQMVSPTVPSRAPSAPANSAQATSPQAPANILTSIDEANQPQKQQLQSPSSEQPGMGSMQSPKVSSSLPSSSPLSANLSSSATALKTSTMATTVAQNTSAPTAITTATPGPESTPIPTNVLPATATMLVSPETTTAAAVTPLLDNQPRTAIDPMPLADPESSIAGVVRKFSIPRATTKSELETAIFYHQILGQSLAYASWSSQNLVALTWHHMGNANSSAAVRRRLVQRDIDHYIQMVATESTRELLNKTRVQAGRPAPIYLYQLSAQRVLGSSTIEPQLLPLGSVRSRSDGDERIRHNHAARSAPVNGGRALPVDLGKDDDRECSRTNHIVRFSWNRSGNYLAAVDKHGHLEVFRQGGTLNEWESVYETNFACPVVVVKWLDQTQRSFRVKGLTLRERDGEPAIANSLGSHTVMSGADTAAMDHEGKQWAKGARVERVRSFDGYEGYGGPRSPYGQHAFLVVTANGLLTMIYYYNGQWKRFSNTLFWTNPDGDNADCDTPVKAEGAPSEAAECMTSGDNAKLAALITHADVAFLSDRMFVLALHRAGARNWDQGLCRWKQPVVEVYSVQIQFYEPFQSLGYIVLSRQDISVEEHSAAGLAGSAKTGDDDLMQIETKDDTRKPGWPTIDDLDETPVVTQLKLSLVLNPKHEELQPSMASLPDAASLLFKLPMPLLTVVHSVRRRPAAAADSEERAARVSQYRSIIETWEMDHSKRPTREGDANSKQDGVGRGSTLVLNNLFEGMKLAWTRKGHIEVPSLLVSISEYGAEWIDRSNSLRGSRYLPLLTTWSDGSVKQLDILPSALSLSEHTAVDRTKGGDNDEASSVVVGGSVSLGGSVFVGLRATAPPSDSSAGLEEGAGRADEQPVTTAILLKQMSASGGNPNWAAKIDEKWSLGPRLAARVLNRCDMVDLICCIISHVLPPSSVDGQTLPRIDNELLQFYLETSYQCFCRALGLKGSRILLSIDPRSSSAIFIQSYIGVLMRLFYLLRSVTKPSSPHVPANAMESHKILDTAVTNLSVYTNVAAFNSFYINCMGGFFDTSGTDENLPVTLKGLIPEIPLPGQSVDNAVLSRYQLLLELSRYTVWFHSMVMGIVKELHHYFVSGDLCRQPSSLLALLYNRAFIVALELAVSVAGIVYPYLHDIIVVLVKVGDSLDTRLRAMGGSLMAELRRMMAMSSRLPVGLESVKAFVSAVRSRVFGEGAGKKGDETEWALSQFRLLVTGVVSERAAFDAKLPLEEIEALFNRHVICPKYATSLDAASNDNVARRLGEQAKVSPEVDVARLGEYRLDDIKPVLTVPFFGIRNRFVPSVRSTYGFQPPPPPPILCFTPGSSGSLSPRVAGINESRSSYTHNYMAMSSKYGREGLDVQQQQVGPLQCAGSSEFGDRGDGTGAFERLYHVNDGGFIFYDFADNAGDPHTPTISSSSTYHEKKRGTHQDRGKSSSEGDEENGKEDEEDARKWDPPLYFQDSVYTLISVPIEIQALTMLSQLEIRSERSDRSAPSHDACPVSAADSAEGGYSEAKAPNLNRLLYYPFPKFPLTDTVRKAKIIPPSSTQQQQQQQPTGQSALSRSSATTPDLSLRACLQCGRISVSPSPATDNAFNAGPPSAFGYRDPFRRYQRACICGCVNGWIHLSTFS
ncbi:hypothetical protein EV182_000530 [Spiromyces aspiralis]|uniref:Uncharacterized protein n=1 Tax=Spiromyces aspiralis TaxID=68401 RepID=A0ACC1HKM6_9FUNG|nr:hypothetical protein EV182_000530 [Spiromyces aspiralis]